MTGNQSTKRYPAELKERAVKMVSHSVILKCSSTMNDSSMRGIDHALFDTN